MGAEGGNSSRDATPSSDAGMNSHDGSNASCPSIGDASPVAPGRVPTNHRASGSACPAQRAPVTEIACGCPDAGTNEITLPDGSVCLCGRCGQDSDCTAGPNGRCYLECSYDECFQDSDCEGGAPCTCRASAASPVPNFCQTGSNCAIDSDCGPGGYCSPSLVNGRCACFSSRLCPDSGASCSDSNTAACECGDPCSHGYFCHTPCDTCTDDSDCGGSGTCNYDWLDHRWECELCLVFP
jgi:hypothetical protein